MAYIHPQSVIDDCNHFRELWGLRSSDPDELQKLFGHLTVAWSLARSTSQHPEATKEELKLMDSVFDIIRIEWSIRYSYMVLQKTGLIWFYIR